MNHVLMDKFFTEDIANTDPASLPRLRANSDGNATKSN